MRTIDQAEQRQRGCHYCADRLKATRVPREAGSAKRYEHLMICAHDTCPYHVLDNIEFYLRDYDEPMSRNLRSIMSDTAERRTLPR